jgi:hypothetical protein
VKGPQIVLLIILAAVVVLAAIAVITVAVRCGWIQGQASVKIVPPWQRKAPEKREVKTAPADGTTAAAPTSLAEKRVS